MKKQAPDMMKGTSYATISTEYEGHSVDKLLHAFVGRFTGWLSPASYSLAISDWLIHLAQSPAKQLDIAKKSWQIGYNIAININDFASEKVKEICQSCHTNDHRFRHPEWKNFPFNVYAEAFLAYDQLWNESGSSIPGLSKHRRQLINFIGNQILDILSPSNFFLTNPEVLRVSVEQQGKNILRGFQNLEKDISRFVSQLPLTETEQYTVGENVAITKGKVIYRNHLIELIQYEPTTTDVHPEPILIIPAWIMKYYILDLSPHNSMVKYLVDNGYTVFIISWKNPKSEDSQLDMDDYLQSGIIETSEIINKIIPNKKMHAVGYCIGGTLLTMAAAYLAEREKAPFKTITLFAAQIDFKDAGELLLFVDESQVSFLEDIMWEKGYLDGSHMAGTFSMLRSVDLIWSRMVRKYLLGEKETMNDLIAWDNDTTRLPYKMHSEYLRRLFLNNELVQGQYTVKNKKIALSDITKPIFCVSTVTDHIAPWKSVYKIHLFTKSDVTFILTSGGHNAGIVNEPGHPNRSFQMHTHHKGEKYLNPEKWLNKAEFIEGSWWPQWVKWLDHHSDERAPLPSMGNPEADLSILCDAPGTYVLSSSL